MRLLSLFFLIVFVCVFSQSCQSNSTSKSEEIAESPLGKVVPLLDDYQIILPNYFVEMTDVNPNAVLQYGFINNQTDSAKDGFEDEIYITVIALPKSELSTTFSDTGRITLNKINDRTAVNLELILDDFKAVDQKPKPTIINGLTAIENAFYGSLGSYEVFYKMAIYESETEFYQLLTWCMEKYAEKHDAEMTSMIQSFENV